MKDKLLGSPCRHCGCKTMKKRSTISYVCPCQCKLGPTAIAQRFHKLSVEKQREIHQRWYS